MSIPELYRIFLAFPVVSTDTRKLVDGCLFFALKGGNFDGNKYAEQAIQSGATYAIIDDPQIFKDSLLKNKMILVTDVLSALQDLSHYHRLQFNIPVIGITGSNGKTTTKELIASVLQSKYQVIYTLGNLNNHIGVPLTLLRIKKSTEIAIIEMGANHEKEIEFLSSIAFPSIGIITNIGKAHLEGFGGIEGVKRTKRELYEHIDKYNGKLIINWDEHQLRELSQGLNCKFISYTTKEATKNIDYMFKLKSEEYKELSVEHRTASGTTLYQSNLLGGYNLGNITTAITLGLHFGLDVESIQTSLKAYQAQNNRSQFKDYKGNTFLMDAYNANPVSMRNALLFFSGFASKKKISILGDMKELGVYSLDEHQSIVDLLISLDCGIIILIGEEFLKTKRPATYLTFENTNDLSTWFNNQSFSEYSILLKGSRSIGLEKLLSLI